jgi:pantothenate kinase
LPQIFSDKTKQDGFHYTRKVLSTFEDAELAFRRRGAPFTFDAAACVELVRKLKNTPVTTDEAGVSVPAPSFDHAAKDPVEGGILIPSRARLVIVEGNYTLLKQTPWSQIPEMCEERFVVIIPMPVAERLILNRWFVDAPVDVVRNRLAQRHLAAGIETSVEAAIARAEENDIPNGELIRSLLVKPDVIIEN